MKKLVLAFVAVAAISFASCGETQKPAADVDTVAVDTEAVDTVDADTVVAEVADSVAE
ncbi:MAG: hypothetical protein IJV27_10875 [Prevotella sp.]|nr:hypothetical protein [Prevotella sp.]